MIELPPRLRLAQLPTPLTRLERFKAPRGVEIWVKRDELTGTEASGNKVRKLEFCLAQALEDGCDTVITCGGVQSNHCRATAVLGARLGLKVHLVLRGERPATVDGNLLMDYLAGATIDYVPEKDYHRHPEIAAALQQTYKREGRAACFIPIGASDEVGMWGYVNASQELKQDFRDRQLKPDALVVASGSGGTQAGLIAGSHLCGMDVPLVAFAVCDDAQYFADKYRNDATRFQQRYAALLGNAADLATLPVTTIDAYIGPGYGRAGPEVFALIRELARTEGLFLDPVYTGKAFHGMLKELETGRLSGARQVIFVHTGGLFGVFPQKGNFVLD